MRHMWIWVALLRVCRSSSKGMGACSWSIASQAVQFWSWGSAVIHRKERHSCAMGKGWATSWGSGLICSFAVRSVQLWVVGISMVGCVVIWR